MVKAVLTLYRGIMKLVTFLLILVSVLMTVVVTSNVLSRYIFGYSIAWSEESARFMFIWLVLLGSIVACDHDRHVHLNWLTDTVGGKGGLAMQIAAKIIMLSALAFLFRGGLTLFFQNLDWRTPALNIPYAWVYLVAPISFGMMFLQTAVKLGLNAKELIAHYSAKQKEEVL
jgi:TRAP-type C4-dicarboxylate transport system permease small subunit